MPRDPVILVEHDPAWRDRFAQLAARASAALAPIEARVEHVGSTAVPGLPAKPIIDLDVIVAAHDVAPALARLGAVGYVAEGDKGIPGREAMRWPPGEARHHLYVCTPDAPGLLDHLAFRDALRADPALVQAYAALKRDLAARHRDDRDAYQEGKGDFIARVTRAARAMA
jgi:GrpB-like predicted nucleotidyltransferase (UPF0157 family)